MKQANRLTYTNRITEKRIQNLKILEMSYSEIQKTMEDLVNNNPTIEIEENVDTYYSSKDLFENALLYAKEKETLIQHLKKQLILFGMSSDPIANFIIDSIDENGKLDYSNEELAKKLNVKLSKINQIINVIQSFEPNGICYRNIQECLLIQLKNKKIFDKLTYSIINNHLGLVANQDYKQIAFLENVSLHEIIEVVKRIKELNPYPASNYETESNYIIPELQIEIENNNIKISYIKEPYFIKIKDYDLSLFTKEEKTFIRKFAKDAQNTIKSVEMRKNTLLRITKCIVSKQKDYFLNSSPLIALKYEDISKELNINESTVCRCVKGKYIQFGNSIFELRSFFSNEVSSGISKNYILKRILKIINEEKECLSDEQISKLLKKEGILVTGRTIGKYRSQMKIPNSKVRCLHKQYE